MTTWKGGRINCISDAVFWNFAHKIWISVPNTQKTRIACASGLKGIVGRKR